MEELPEALHAVPEATGSHHVNACDALGAAEKQVRFAVDGSYLGVYVHKGAPVYGTAWHKRGILRNRNWYPRARTYGENRWYAPIAGVFQPRTVTYDDTSAPVAWDSHKGWFETRLADPHTRIWIVERDAIAVGAVRLQDKGDGPEVAIYIDAPARGAGIAGAALSLALDEAHSVWPGREAIARVRSDNIASRRLFEGAGFALRHQAEDHLVYLRAL